MKEYNIPLEINSGDDTDLIIGLVVGIIGGLLCITAIVVIIILFRRRNKN